MTHNVFIEHITIPDDRQHCDEGSAKSLAESIKQRGLLHPIGLTPDHALIFGRRRIEAHRQLGLATIPATIFPFDLIDAQLAEIDENIERRQFDALEWSKLLARRKKLYETKYPETKRGAAGGRARQDPKAADGNLTPGSGVSSFVEDTAEKTGKSKSTIHEDAALGNQISDAAAIQIHGLPIADNKTQLKKLAALSEKDQLAVALKIKAGKAKTVDEAMAKPKPAPPVSDTAPETPEPPPARTAKDEGKDVIAHLGALVRAADRRGCHDEVRPLLDVTQAFLVGDLLDNPEVLALVRPHRDALARIVGEEL